jgi:thiol-disulfide isomerase/thioredoxin
MASKKPRPMHKPVSRTPAWVTPAAGAVGVALVVAAFLAIRWYNTPPAPKPLKPDAAQLIVDAITSLPASELDGVGQGSVKSNILAVVGKPLTGTTGKPEVFYLGAEYCPYCAAERWPMIIALSRFGTFSGLETTSSSSTDVYPNTPTFTFKNATYTSQYIDFRSVETEDRNGNPLQSPTAADQALVTSYDKGGSIPFVDLGNRYAFAGSNYFPDSLAGMSWQEVADSLQQPGTPQAQAILGSANLITAAVCKLTGDQPAAVCSSAAIQAIEKKLG